MENQRHKESGGQALVMVTLSLMAMAGLMGLAVDLGWSYFVQKEAQAAADGAALAAAEEALVNLRTAGAAVTGFSCGTANVECKSKTGCDKVANTSNLYNGCLYAKANGFDYTNASSRQKVTIQSDITSPPPTAPGVNNLSYWVTVRKVQTIPQLFSAVLGNTLGTVSAIGTAGIVGSLQPGSFFGMNQAGDCITDPGSLGFPGCGLDIITGTGAGGMNCPGAPNGKADVCAPSGIILGSSCHGIVLSVQGQCSQAYAADSKGPGVYASSITVMQDASGSGVLHGNNWNPATPTPSSNPNTFQDPLAPNSQPPLQTPASSAIGSCGYPGGVVSGKNVTLGPYQYYSYKVVGGQKVPDGQPISFTGDVTFSANATGSCPGGGTYVGGSVQSASFPSYIFYGGLATGNNATFGPGQYVMAGTVSNASGATVFNANGANITGDQTTGTMFIFTDANYPGLASQIAAIPGAVNMPTLYQGSLSFKNADISLYGLVGSSNNSSNLPSSMDIYSGVAWWQDRRNSTDGYNEASGSLGCPDCTKDDGSVVYCNNADCPLSTPAKLTALKTANHVTATSPGVSMDPGNGNIAVHGVYYQPRGAWLEFVHGTTGFSCGAANCPLQVVTGALIEDSGDTGLLLSGPANPLVKYRAALIQ